MSLKNSLFGNRDFYRRLIIIFVPIMVQNAVTSFVGLLDNIMVGQTGTIPMSGVSIANQLLNVFMLTTYGAMSAVGIFLTQYKGRDDEEGILNCFKIKLLLAAFISVVVAVSIFFFGDKLVLLYLPDNVNDPATIAQTLEYGFSYLKIMITGMVLFEFSQVYMSTTRECGDTMVSMVSSIVAVFVNAALNYVLIFGKLGFPELGTDGAAYATVISRFFELAILVLYTYMKRELRYLTHFFKKTVMPKDLISNIAKRGTPLLVNEVLFSIGQAATIQCYATRGLTAIAAMNICTTVSNVFYIACYAMGNAIAIMVGQQLGKGETTEAKYTATRIMFADFLTCVLFGVAMYFTAPIFPEIYNTTDDVKLLAKQFLDICAIHLPIMGVYLASYFVLRSGGKTFLTFLFDGFSTACVIYPIAFILSRFTSLNALMLYLIIYMLDLPKAILGIWLVLKGIWIQNIVNFKN